MASFNLNHKVHYKTAMSHRDYTYFDSYSEEDQRKVIEEARLRLHENNINKMKECLEAGNNTHMLGIVSHELRTPLNALVGIIDLMQADSMTEDQRLYIKSLEQSSTYLHSVVNRLQDLAALLHGQATLNSMPLDIVAIMTGVAESMQHYSSRTGRGTQITLELDPKLPLSVDGDLTKIQQVITNLATVAVTSSSDKHAHLKAALIVDGPIVQIRFTISSLKNQTPPGLLDGIGLEFTAEDLFKPTTDDNMYQGLVISREFVSMLGSRLDMSQEEDGSLCFTFDLKLAHPRGAAGDVWPDNQSNYGDLVAKSNMVKVLVVDDNVVNLRIATTMLKRLGFEPVTAENGLEAVGKMHQSSYDIVLMDCDMPLCNGYDATQHIRTKMKNDKVIIIALTADSTNEAKNRCISVGMNDYFVKPITMKTLSEMLHKWLPTTFNAGAKSSGRRP